MIVDNTNLYSVQKTPKVSKQIQRKSRHILACKSPWELSSYRHIATTGQGLWDIPLLQMWCQETYEILSRYLHFVDNDSVHDVSDKLFKIRPILTAVRNECLKVELEEYHSIDEQIIPSKTKYTKMRQYNPKKPRKWGFKT